MCTLPYRVEESYRANLDGVGEMEYTMDIKQTIKDGMQSFESREEAMYYYLTASKFIPECCEMHIISRWILDRLGW